MNIVNKLVLLLVLMPARLFAVTYSLEGEMAKDFSLVQATITISGIENSSLKSSSDNLRNYLRIFAPSLSSEQPIRTSRGSDDLTDQIDDLFWDIEEATVEKLNETTTGFDARYVVKIYQNLDKENGRSLKDLAADGKTINFMIGFWRWSPSENGYVKDSVSATIPVTTVYAAPNEVPEITSVTAANRSLKIKWNAATSTVYSDSRSRTSPNLYIILIEKDGLQTIDFSNQSYVANLDGSGSGSDSQAGGCVLDPSQTDCLSCAEANAYLDYKSMTERAAASAGSIVVSSVSAAKGALEIAKLDPEKTYVAFMQFDRGLKRSQCTSGQPILDVTMAEANGEGDAGYGSPSCFIATAAFGSKLHPYVGLLRWFRDRYLLTTSFGRVFVAEYYRYGEHYAKYVAQSAVLKLIAQGLLLPIIGIVMLFKLSAPLAMTVLVSGFFALLFSFSTRMRSLIKI